jgi:hypothetical protein
MKARRFIFRALPFFAIGALLSQITAHSPPPEAATTLWFALPTFLIFILFGVAMISLGAKLRTRFLRLSVSGVENGLVDLTLGSVGFYLLAYDLTCAHCFSADHAIFLWAILSCFFAWGIDSIWPIRWFEFAKSKAAKIYLAIPLLIILLRLLEGLELHAHGDAYITYLPAPRMWAVQGNFNQWIHFSQFFLSTSFESCFAWGTALMGLRGGAGLDLTQYFSQWCVGGIALLGILLGTLALCKRLAEKFPVSEIYFPMVAVAAMQIPVLRWTANLAKNDMGVAFWGLSAFYFTLFLAPISPLLAFTAGLIAGSAVIGKLTLSLFAIFLAVYVLIFNPKKFAWFALGGVSGGLPVFLRNYFLTGNPVFPWLPNFFPNSILSQVQVKDALHATASTFNLANLGGYFLELQGQLPLLFILIIVFIFIRNRHEFLRVISVPVSAAILFTFVLRSSTEIRYQNATLVVLAILTTFFTFQMLTILPLPKRMHRYLSPLFAIIIVATANITTFTLFQIGSEKFSPIAKALPSMEGGEAKLWMRRNLKPDDSILLVGDPHVYYLIDYDIREIHQTPDLDDVFSSGDSNASLAAILKSSFRFLCIDTDNAFWESLPEAKALRATMSNTPDSCQVFLSDKAQIWDLRCIRNLASRNR